MLRLKNEMIKNEFYEKKNSVYDLLPNNKSKILLGDLNAKIKQESIFHHTIRNSIFYFYINNRVITWYKILNLIIVFDQIKYGDKQHGVPS